MTGCAPCCGSTTASARSGQERLLPPAQGGRFAGPPARTRGDHPVGVVHGPPAPRARSRRDLRDHAAARGRQPTARATGPPCDRRGGRRSDHRGAGGARGVAPTHIGKLTFARRVDYDVRANWKVYVDNYLEGYHVPYVHPELYSLYDYEGYVTEVHDWYSVQVGPLTGDSNVYTAGGGEALYYQVFPNLMLNVVPGRLQSNLVIPVAPDRCKVIFRYYYDDVASPAARERIEADIAFSDKVQHEDAEICERVQKGLGSRAYDKGRFSVRFEEGVYHFQKLLKHAYRTWLKR